MDPRTTRAEDERQQRKISVRGKDRNNMIDTTKLEGLQAVQGFPFPVHTSPGLETRGRSIASDAHGHIVSLARSSSSSRKRVSSYSPRRIGLGVPPTLCTGCRTTRRAI